jgi:release factor glutamine methyltransferase
LPLRWLRLKLLELLDKTAAYFAKQGVASPRLQIESLLAHVLKLPRMQLYLQFERIVNPAELDALRPLVKRRAEGEPLQHILGETGFCGLTLACSPAALVPRPETEVLVDLAAATLAPLPPGHLVDVGTGTGAIALALARALPAWKISATDVSPDALALARRNAAAQEGGERVEFTEADLLGTIQPDAVIANLPYLTDAEMDALPPEVRHDPALALRGGPDGLDLVRRLIATLPPSVHTVALELGVGQADTVAGLLDGAGFNTIRKASDLSERERFVIARKG